MQILLNEIRVRQLMEKLADDVAAQIPPDAEVAVIGIRSRGEILAQRLARSLGQRLSRVLDCGALDITLYRDDINDPQGTRQLKVRATEIGFDISDKHIILVDDVLYTGRSARSAMDALIDLGRPAAIRLAVLIERQGREVPIQADFVAYHGDIEPGRSVRVHLVESDGVDEVAID